MIKRHFLFLSFILIFISLFNAYLTLQFTHEKVGKSFPGYLAFENGVVGAFYLADWSGTKRGLKYHDRADPQDPLNDIFSQRDYVLTVLLPTFSGLFFILLGTGVCFYLTRGSGSIALLLFHFFAGNYLILSPEFHLTHHLSLYFLLFFAFIPAGMIHFALSFPDEEKGRLRFILPYFVSALFSVPYLYFFMRDPTVWIGVEYAVVYYMAGAYFFWIYRLAKTLKKPQLEFNRIIARTLLLGQISAFVVPLLAAISIFVMNISLPLNLAAPFTLLFPIALFVGAVLGKLKQSQMQLIQAEKRAAFGNLLSGLAHEINNPLTFIYSGIEPLRERIEALNVHPSVKQDITEIVEVMEEGATRARAILANFRHFSGDAQDSLEKCDLREVMDQSLELLSSKWKGRIEVMREYQEIPRVSVNKIEMGQVFLNLLSNACDSISGNGKIFIRMERHDAGIRILISDSGVGMSKEILKHVFDPFFTTKAQGDGTGLGLAIVLEIIKKHKGTIDVKSEIGKGSEFVVTLPVGAIHELPLHEQPRNKLT